MIPVIVTKNVYKKLHNRNKKGTKNGHYKTKTKKYNQTQEKAVMEEMRGNKI